MSIVGLSLGTTDFPQILDAQAMGVQPCMSFKNPGCPACALAMTMLCVFTSIAVNKHQLRGVILPCLCTQDIKQQGMKVAYDRIVFLSNFCSSCNKAAFQRCKRPSERVFLQRACTRICIPPAQRSRTEWVWKVLYRYGEKGSTVQQSQPPRAGNGVLKYRAA